MSTSEWHHIAVTWNRLTKEAKIYLNFALKISATSTLDNVDLFNTGESYYELGANNGARFFKGYLAYFIVFPSVLEPREIKKLEGNV